jgi:hypothetical protein
MARRRNNGGNPIRAAGEYVKLEDRLVLVAWLSSLQPESDVRLD